MLVKMHCDYPSLNHQGVELTIEPKKDGVYDIIKDVPTLKGLLLAIIIVVALYGLSALFTLQGLQNNTSWFLLAL